MFRRSWSPISRLRLPTPRWESTKQGFQGLLPNSPSQKILTVSLVGRPNTGKSTLFNRLTKSNKAIVSNIPGTTRDRAEGKGYIAGVPIKVYDTGGLDDRGQFIGDVVNQVGRAIAQSDLILFLLDARTGVTATDRKFATWVRETMAAVKQERQERYSPHPTKILLVANKTEGAHSSDFVVEVVSDSFGLGFGEPLLISAIHGDGMGDLGLEVLKLAREYNYDDGETQPHLMQAMPNSAADPQGSINVTAPKARVGDKQLKVKYITQVKSRPPTFTLFCNADELPTFFERYLRSKIQDEFKLEGVPIRFVVKKSEGNEVKKHLLKQGKHSRRGTGLGEAKGKLGPEGKKNRRTVDFYAKHKSRSEVEQRRRRDTRLRKKRGV
eukprot:gene6015-4317_t